MFFFRFLIQDLLECHLSPFAIVKGITCFSRFELCFETQVAYIFLFLPCKTFRAIFSFFFSNFFQSIFFWQVIYSLTIIFIYIRFYICYSFEFFFFFFFWRFNGTVTAYWKYLPFLFIVFIVVFMFFIQSGEPICDPRRFRYIFWQFHQFL